jgi:hypothetical protein
MRKDRAAFVRFGCNLLAIRDRKLYRGTYATFEQYCERVWHISRPHAYRMMSAVKTAALVSPNGDIPSPTKESQTRALAPLRHDPERAREAWANAVDDAHGGQPTGAQVEHAVSAVLVPTGTGNVRTSEEATEYVWMGWARRLGETLDFLAQMITYADEYACDLDDFDGINAANAEAEGVREVTAFALALQRRIADAGIGADLRDFLETHTTVEGNDDLEP